MKICVKCGAEWSLGVNQCQHCGMEEICIDGFTAYAPDMAYRGGGFRPEAYETLAKLESENFWFRGRNNIIEWACMRYIPELRSIMEIGCGTGYVLECLSKIYPSASVLGTEVFIEGLPYASRRVPEAKFAQMDACRIPFKDEFHLIGAFDVIEHIKDDESVLAEVFAALKPDGVLILTVPQHQCLWSPADDYAMHERRYGASELHLKLRRAGFKIRRSSSFVSLLLPMLVISRWKMRRTPQKHDPTAELKLNRWLDRILGAMMVVELLLIRHGFNFPWGGSRLVVAQKGSTGKWTK